MNALFGPAAKSLPESRERTVALISLLSKAKPPGFCWP
jgi:hypothetical protein